MRFSVHTASIAAFPTNKSSSRKSPPGSTTAMPTTPRPTGNSPPKMLASNLSIYTLQSDSIRRLDESKIRTTVSTTCCKRRADHEPRCDGVRWSLGAGGRVGRRRGTAPVLPAGTGLQSDLYLDGLLSRQYRLLPDGCRHTPTFSRGCCLKSLAISTLRRALSPTRGNTGRQPASLPGRYPARRTWQRGSPISRSATCGRGQHGV